MQVSYSGCCGRIKPSRNFLSQTHTDNKGFGLYYNRGYLVASIVFRLVKMLVRGLQQILTGAWVISIPGRDADATRYSPRVKRRQAGGIDGIQNPLGGINAAPQVISRQKGRKFFAAVTDKHVRLTEAIVNNPNKRHQYFVAHGMPKLVINLFKIIYVHHKARKRHLCP